MTGVQCPFFDLLPEDLPDGIIEQGVFIGEVRVKRGAVDLGFVGDVLHRDGLESFFSEESAEGFEDQVAGPFDAGVEFFIFFWVRQHFRSSVV